MDKDQNITRFDANGTMVSQEDANGNFLLYEMDETGLLKTVTTDKNQSLKMQYNDQNLLKEIELADGTKMQYTYDTAGDLTNAAHVSADGTQSVQEPYAYDKEHHMTAITDAEGNDYGVTYEGEKAVRFTKPDGEYQQITYGDGTTMVSLHKSDGTKISEDSMTYEKNSGKLLSSTNGNGVKTTYQYENTENPLLQTGTETTVCYQTLENNQVNFKNDVKVTTTTSYDSNENVVEEVDETGQVTSTTYGTGKEFSLAQTEVIKNSEGETTQTQPMITMIMEIRSLSMKISEIAGQSIHMMRMGKSKKNSPMRMLSQRGCRSSDVRTDNTERRSRPQSQ